MQSRVNIGIRISKMLWNDFCKIYRNYTCRVLLCVCILNNIYCWCTWVISMTIWLSQFSPQWKLLLNVSVKFDNFFITGTRMRDVFFFPIWLFMFDDAIEFKEDIFCFSECLTNSSTIFSSTATPKTWEQYFSSLKCLQSLSQHK